MVFVSLVPLSACFVRKRVIAPPSSALRGPLLIASKNELIERVHRIADPLESFNMRVRMSPSMGSLYVGEVKDYATLGGYILYRRPDDIRILGLDPVLSSTVFDMVSVGAIFRIHIPSKSRFLEGRNDVPASAEKKWENLRPVAFLTSLIIQPPDPQTDITVLEEDISEREAAYTLLIIRRSEDEPWLLRTLRFDRHNLEIIQQKTFDSTGGLLSDTTYSDWKIYDGVPFPSEIDVRRPQDHYEVIVSVVNLRINPADLTAEKFVLAPPPGVQLEQLSK